MIEDLRNTADLNKKQSEAIPQIINLKSSISNSVPASPGWVFYNLTSAYP